MMSDVVIYALRSQLRSFANRFHSAQSKVMELEPQIDQAKRDMQVAREGAEQIVDYAERHDLDLDVLEHDAVRYAFPDLADRLPIRITPQPVVM